MESKSYNMDIVKRFEQNPILSPSMISPSAASMKIECLLNPGVFRFKGMAFSASSRETGAGSRQNYFAYL
jgi:hypothetical protein